MPNPRYAWLTWSLLLLVVWLVVFVSLRERESRRKMLTVSLWTSLAGLTEPLFVPAYWTPPTLFDLAARTGLDIESLLFSFGVGGLAVVIYEWIFMSREEMITPAERQHRRHRYHRLMLLSAPLTFVLLITATRLNVIYATVIALLTGGVFTWYCRPDLKVKMFVSAFICLGLYVVYFFTLIYVHPAYVKLVWNLPEISGLLILGIPIEELMFAFAFGFMWSSVYEHLRWRRLVVKASQ